MGTLTVSRFYVLHVFVLPGILIALHCGACLLLSQSWRCRSNQRRPCTSQAAACPVLSTTGGHRRHLCHHSDRNSGSHRDHHSDGSGSSRQPRGYGVSSPARVVLPTSISMAQVPERQLVSDRRHHSARCPCAYLCRPAVSGSTARTQTMAKANRRRRIPALPDCLHVSWSSELSRRPSRSGSSCANAEAG